MFYKYFIYKIWYINKFRGLDKFYLGRKYVEEMINLIIVPKGC